MKTRNRDTVIQCVIATAILCVSSQLHAANIIIDAFTTSQGQLTVSPLLGPQTDSSSASGAGILGGSRDLVLSTDAGASPFNANAQVAGGFAQLADNTQFSSDLLFQWDGGDNDPSSVNPMGLGGVDLTSGGNNALELGLIFEDLPAFLEFNVYSMNGNLSTVTFPGTGLIFTNLSLYIPYAAFSGNADFTNVGAIELLISSPTNGLDISFDYIQTGIAPVPLPGAALFMGSALFGLGLLGRRDKAA